MPKEASFRGDLEVQKTLDGGLCGKTWFSRNGEKDRETYLSRCRINECFLDAILQQIHLFSVKILPLSHIEIHVFCIKSVEVCVFIPVI